jgi:hypothetical protein
MNAKKLTYRKTKYEEFKFRLIEIFNTLLNEYESDIESGINEGIYDVDDNKRNRTFIEEARKIIGDFSAYVPAIYIYIEGCNIQGISATECISFNKFDMDDYNALIDDANEGYTPDSWDKMITEQSNTGEIRPIY